MCVAVFAPEVVWSQNPAKLYRLGILANTAARYLTEPLLAALHGRGWSVGKNLQVEYRVTAGDIV
ncbi:MAG TPA: hypothetical protein VGJ74_02680, partial [Burkholderiales bacterium]